MDLDRHHLQGHIEPSQPEQAWSIQALGFHSNDVFWYHAVTMVLK